MMKSNTEKNERDLWATPLCIFKGIEKYLAYNYCGFSAFDLDASALPHNAKCKDFISPKQDTLKTDWGQGRNIWINPPYSNPLPFVKRAAEMSLQNNFIVMLLPSDTSTEWFEVCQQEAETIIFLTGKGARIHFDKPDGVKRSNGNVKGSILVIFNNLHDNPFLHPMMTCPLSLIQELGEEERGFVMKQNNKSVI